LSAAPKVVAVANSWSKAASRERSSTLRALFVVNSLNVGGSETKAVRVANGLARQGVRAGITYLNGPDLLRSSIDSNVPVWHLERRGRVSLVALRTLRRVIREQRPDVIFAMSLYPSLYVSLATAGMKDRPRTAALINTTDFRRARAWEPAFYRPFLRRLDSTVYGCELQRDRWLGMLGSQAHSDVIYNGVDIEHFAPASAEERLAARQQFGIARDAFVVGSVGRLAPEKNHSVLIEVLAELRGRGIDAHLLIAGEGRTRGEIERRIASLGVQMHVTLPGMQRDVRLALSAMDVFVLPSSHVETFSNAALEAMAMGRPVILSRIGGAAEMISGGVEGYTIDCAELHTELPSRLGELYTNRTLRERMGRAARDRVVARFSLQAMVNRYVELLDVLQPPLQSSGKS
jgi:glycosyltransferase involved in cell wall biosynthesis